MNKYGCMMLAALLCGCATHNSSFHGRNHAPIELCVDQDSVSVGADVTAWDSIINLVKDNPKTSIGTALLLGYIGTKNLDGGGGGHSSSSAITGNNKVEAGGDVYLFGPRSNPQINNRPSDDHSSSMVP